MYPDREDIARAMAKLTGIVPRPNPSAIWLNIALAREFVSQVREACWSHGRHRFIPANDLRAGAEAFIQRSISPFEFCTALLLAAPAPRMMPDARPIDIKRFDALKIKFPPIARVNEFREEWSRVQASVEQEFAREVERPKLFV